MAPPIKFTDAVIAKVRAMASDHTMDQLQQALAKEGISFTVQTIRKYCRQHGIHLKSAPMGPRVHTWNNEMVAQLKGLLHEGLSTRQIAARLGVSRNAVAGKIHRLHHSLHPCAPSAQSATTRPQSMVRPVLRASTCEYPMDGEDGAYHFCGQKTDGHSSYCSVHHAICSSPASAPSYHEAA